MEIGQKIEVPVAIFAPYTRLVDEVQAEGPLALLFRGAELNRERFRIWQRVQKLTGLDVIRQRFRADIKEGSVYFEGDKLPEEAEADERVWAEMVEEFGEPEMPEGVCTVH